MAVLCPEGDNVVINLCKNEDMEYETGHPIDLIERYLSAARDYAADAIVRVTGDCPLIPINLIRQAIRGLTEASYVTNTITRTYPDGYDVQAFSINALRYIDDTQKEHREHPFYTLDHNEIVRDGFEDAGYNIMELQNVDNPIFIKVSVDTQEDLERVRRASTSQKK